MATTAVIAALWIAFAATHVGLSSRALRPRLVARLGERGFLGVYSLLALAIFVPLVSVYFGSRHAGPHLWYLGVHPAVRWLAYLGMALALVLFFGGLLRPSPASLAPGSTEVRGPLRWTRHPLLMSFGLFGLVHLLVANVNAAELAFFAGFPLFVWVGCRHQDQRKLASGDERFARFHAQTCFWPGARSGRLRGLREMPVALVLGLAAAAALRWVHPGWFGGAGYYIP